MDTNGNVNNIVSYIAHIQKLFQEYEQLQLQHSRLRQQLNEQVFTINGSKLDSNHLGNDSSSSNNNKSIEELKIELEYEKANSKSMANEVAYLLNQNRAALKRYNDLLSIVKCGKDKQGTPDSNSEKISELTAKLSKIEDENRDLKENIEFVTSEAAVLTESIKELEEMSFKERMEWLQEKEKYEEVVEWSRKKYHSSKEEQTKIDKLMKENSLYEDLLKFIQNFVDKPLSLDENKNSDDIISKIDSIKEVIKSNFTEQTNLKTENAIKIKSIAEFQQQIEVLSTENKRLLSENGELKLLIKQDQNVDVNQMELKLEIANINSKLSEQQEINEKLMQKYTRNRKVWENNESKLTEEIERLDNFIALLFDTLEKLPSELKLNPEFQYVLDIIKQSTDQKEINNQSHKD